MPALEVLALNKTVPRIEAPQVGDTYSFPRVAEFLAGAVGAPSITFTGDPNTGFWSPAADTVAVSTGGSERIRWASTGTLLRGEASGGTPANNGNALRFVRSDGQLMGYIGWSDETTSNASWLFRSSNGNPINWSVAPSGAQLTLDYAGNLGLGVTPSAWESSYRALQFGTGSAFLTGRVGALQNRQFFLGVGAWHNGTNWIYTPTGVPVSYYAQSDGVHQWFTAASGTSGAAVTFTQAMTLDAAGNLGLGVTPSAWASSVRALETATGAFYSFTSGSVSLFYMLSNAFLNSAGTPTYKQTAAAAQYLHSGGTHQWFTAPSGTAGTAITFTQAMTLTAGGDLLLGGTTSQPISAFSGVSKGMAITSTGPTIALVDDEDATNYISWLAQLSGELYLYNKAAAANIRLGTNTVERVRIKSAGQVRFVPLAAAPTVAVEDGDVYYDSGTNKLRVRAGGVWVDLH